MQAGSDPGLAGLSSQLALKMSLPGLLAPLGCCQHWTCSPSGLGRGTVTVSSHTAAPAPPAPASQGPLAVGLGTGAGVVQEEGSLALLTSPSWPPCALRGVVDTGSLCVILKKPL